MVKNAPVGLSGRLRGSYQSVVGDRVWREVVLQGAEGGEDVQPMSWGQLKEPKDHN
jgi:hypothetical protein